MKITVKNLSKHYIKDIDVLKNLNFQLESSYVITLLGAVDAGKTSFFDILTKLEKSYQGDIFFDDINIKEISQKDLKILYLTSHPMLIQGKTVFANAVYSLKKRKITTVSDMEVEEMLCRFGLLDKKNLKAKLLTDFDKYKLALCRGLLWKPNVILVDDCFYGKGSDVEIKWTGNLKDLLKGFGEIVIFATSTIDVAKALDNKTIVLNEGEITFQGDFKNSKYYDITE